MNGIPLLFTFRDRIVGMGFNAVVTSYGRVLGVVEGDRDIWIYGVEPGALAASGTDPKEALEEFRQTFTKVLRDFAAEAHSFAEFEEATQRFFAGVNVPNEQAWLLAVDAVRAGTLVLDKMPQEPAESRRFVQVIEEIEEGVGDGRLNFAVTGSEITSALAA